MSDYEKFKAEKRKSAYIKKEKNDLVENKVIFGAEKDFSKKVTPIEDINDSSGKVATCGAIFSIEAKEIYGNRNLYKFDIVNSEGSAAISCKVVLERYSKKNVELRNLKKGQEVTVFGEAQYDKYARDTVVSVSAIRLEECHGKQRLDSAKEKRIEFHAHTQMSTMDGLANATELVQRAVAWGHKAIAITDHGVVQAFPEAYKEAKKHEDFKLIYGLEGYLTDEAEKDCGKQKSHHITILAQNKEGLKNLYKLITYSHTENFYKKPRIDRETLRVHRKGLLLGTACEQGELFRAIYDGKNDDIIRKIADFYDYFEVMPLGINGFMVTNGERSWEDLKNINSKIVALGEKMGKPVLATGDVHFIDEKDAQYRAILQAGQGYDDADNQAPLYLRTTDEMLAEFDYLDEKTARKIVIENPNSLFKKIEKLKPIPDGAFPPFLEGAEENVRQMCWSRARELYGEPLPDVVGERIEKELSKIVKYGFSVMYQIAHELVAKSNSDGYIVGSRGSVGSSFVAFLCEITDVNALPPHYRCDKCKISEFYTDGSISGGFDLPDKKCVCGEIMQKDGHDIPFETFLGFEGDKEPDIDLNFSGDYQAKAHKFVEELFGVENVFRAGTISTLASRTAFGFVKKYMETRGIEANNASLNYKISKCEGVKRTTGQHPGGLMILPKGRDIHEFCPVQYPADDKTKKVLTTHFSYKSLSGRLLKIDALGHDDPTVIKMLEDLTGVDSRTIPLDDKKVMSLFKSTKALGVTPEQIGTKVGTLAIPEFGTGFVQKMLLDTKPTTFSELVRISGLSHGEDVWLGNVQEYIRQGKTTLKEASCTRDDIMLYLIYNGLPAKDAFDIMERVRKDKTRPTREDEELMREKKIPEWYIESCNKIKYLFPKAHAVAYVTMAFKIAWFKVYYPLEFYLAYLTVRADEFNISLMADIDLVRKNIKRLESEENSLNQKDKNVLSILQVVREMFARGFKFLPVDLYKSDIKGFEVEGDAIRPPLIAVQGLGLSVAETIDSARNEAEFSSIEDLKNRTKTNKAIIELLEEQGVLAGLPASDQMSFF